MLGTVEGNLWATKKAAAPQGRAFLTVRLEDGRGALVCADCVGAGRGERVLVATGAAARAAAGDGLPVDAAIVGIVHP